MISQGYVSGEKPKMKKRERRLLTPVIQAIKNFDLAKVGSNLNLLEFSCKKNMKKYIQTQKLQKGHFVLAKICDPVSLYKIFKIHLL